MPVWFPSLDKLVTFIPEPPLGAGGFDDGSLGTPEGSLDGLDDDDFFDSAERTQDFGNASVSFNDDDMLYDGNDSMNYFDAMYDMDDLDGMRCVSTRLVPLDLCSEPTHKGCVFMLRVRDSPLTFSL